MLKSFFTVSVLLCVAVLAAGQQMIRFSGKVIDDQSKPVPGASLQVLNTNAGAFTDEQGHFVITNLPPGTYKVQVTAIGFAAVEKEFSGKENSGIIIVLPAAARQLDEVIIAAQKKEERLQQVPFSVSALPARQVQAYRIWNNSELTAIVPNLYAGNPGDDRNVTSIRGITSTSYDPAVTTYIDGVNQFSLDTYIGNLLDVERIEVLRGPQGTLYGRNAMGGVINIITRQPTNRPDGFAEVNVGNYGLQRYSAGFRTALVKNKLFVGAAEMYDASSGFYTNDFNGSKFDRQHNITGNYFVKWLPATAWAVTLNVKHHDTRNNGTFPLVNGVQDAFANPYRLNQNALTQMHDNTFNASLAANYAGANFNFASQTAWQSDYRFYDLPIDGDFSPIDGVTIINNYGHRWNNVKVLTQEFRLSSPAGNTKPFDWTAGTYLFYQDVPNKQATHFGEDAELVGAPDKNFAVITTSKGKNVGMAFYGQASYKPDSSWEFTAGLRYDFEHKKLDVLGQYQQDPNPDPVFDTRPDTSAAADFGAFSPRFSIAYHLSAKQQVYVTYSRGYRTGGLTQLSSDPSQPPLYRFKPEYSNNYEIGTKKNLLQNRLRINVSLFYSTIENAQVPTLILPDAITVTKNAGKLSSKGIELELAAAPVKGLQVDYNAGYTNASYKTLKLALYGNEVDLSGNKQIFTPEVTSMLAAQYSYEINARQHVNAFIRGEWMYLGKEYFDLANTIQQNPYSLFNAKLGVSVKKVDIFLWGRNLADKKYIAYAYDFGAVHLGNPKTYGVTFRLMFR